MTLVATLGDLLRLRLSVRLDGDRLRLAGPRSAVGGIQESVKRHKAEIVALLRPPDSGNVVGAASDAGDVIRQKLADDLAGRSDVDELMSRFDRRRLVSLPAQYPHPAARLTDETAAAMAATEIRITYVRGLS